MKEIVQNILVNHGKPQTMICPNCQSTLKKVKVEIEDTTAKALSYQCPNCDYFAFNANLV